MLFAQELVTLLGFFVFLDRHEVHRPHLIQPHLQCRYLLGNHVPICGRAAGRHFFRRHHMHFCRTFIGESNGDALAANIVEV